MLYEVLSRQLYHRRKWSLVRLAELVPVTHEVVREPATVPTGTMLRDGHGTVWRVMDTVGEEVALRNKGKQGTHPAGDYLEQV